MSDQKWDVIAWGVGLQNRNFKAFALAVGARTNLSGGLKSTLREYVERPGFRLLSRGLGEKARTHAIRARAIGRNVARKVLGRKWQRN